MQEVWLIGLFWGLIGIGFIEAAIKCWRRGPRFRPIRFWLGLTALVFLAILFIVATNCALCIALS